MSPNLRSTLAVISAIGLIATVSGGQTTAFKTSTMTPCMEVLPLFTAANVPAFAATEIETSDNYTKGISLSGVPGKGLAQHPMLYVGENCNKMFLVNGGKVIWTYSTGPRPEFDDVWMLSNGNILFSRMEYVARHHAGQKSGVALRLPRAKRCGSHGNSRLPAHRLGQSHVR